MKSVILKVDGMSCNHCKISIEKALRGLGAEADVDMTENTVSVNYDNEKVKLEQIINEIEEQGYNVEK